MYKKPMVPQVSQVNTLIQISKDRYKNYDSLLIYKNTKLLVPFMPFDMRAGNKL